MAMKLTTELEKLAKMMPKEWQVEVRSSKLLWHTGHYYLAELWDGETESPEIINWALDELAKHPFNWGLLSHKHGWFCANGEVETGYYPTKTLALVMALLEVCG